eukprot:CAMPEP_0114431864 /NCGR_PEP_ID=MMETSP0103-20121206/10842_1 /TAXON_ID=37642 ORGANISM="Paraphysomonas imperforata, Strain PA2" /NCGR_SAMPLE_ID=MMETSP0103 /ASSEMBLY_ACC=CAM_ASM_000201 /LENGTH=305 /DNA_ID=CAMNT_0001601487 /DNA_START=18 /DNA_END=938 /DNA_ORIENTATION=-
MKTSVALLLLSATGTSACPGSPVRMHAKCEMEVEFTQPCDSVLTEINARVSGKGGWTDPHNGGIYSITNQTSTFLSGQRITGDGKYTDLFDFSFTSSSGGCSVEACSESQVNSLLDFSTNYCNLHSLYCSSSSGCPTVGADLVYNEKYSSCRQHDDVCVASPQKIPVVASKVKDEQQCAADIGAASAAITTAGIKIADATESCADGFTASCNNDINAVLLALNDASSSITAAVFDCGGTEMTPCAEDINNVITDVTNATIEITDAVINCGSDAPGSTAKCTSNIADATKSIGSLAKDIASAVEDC